jgi:hypothetical protein
LLFLSETSMDRRHVNRSLRTGYYNDAISFRGELLETQWQVGRGTLKR